MGFDTFNIGPEAEFFLFKDDKGTEVLDHGGYFDLTTLDVASDFRRDVFFTLKELGIHVEYQHHEVGPSQHEIDMRYEEGLTMSDHVMTYKTAVKEVAMEHGYYATFMPKPLFGENGSGMHTHMSLFSGGQNAFFDADDEWFLSDVAKQFIAGLLLHAREISALFAPLVNSYKRLVPGYEAPVYSAWSRRNRSALVRVPMYEPGEEKATRAELRCPDPSCNPYLAFAAMLHAGLEGIEKGYELPPPMERNLYDMSGRRARGEHRRHAAAVTRRGDRGDGELHARAPRTRRPRIRQLHRAQEGGVGRLPGAGHALGVRPLPRHDLSEGPDREPEGAPHTGASSAAGRSPASRVDGVHARAGLRSACAIPAATSASCAPAAAPSSRSASARAMIPPTPATRACRCSSAEGTSLGPKRLSRRGRRRGAPREAPSCSVSAARWPRRA